VGTSPQLDFFISYTAVNRSWAEWIAVQLEQVGYTTKLQSWDFAAGTDFVHGMQEAGSAAARTVAVLSPAYFSSKVGEAEWRAVFVRDPSGEFGLLVPVRVQPCEPPGLLALAMGATADVHRDLEHAEAVARRLDDDLRCREARLGEMHGREALGADGPEPVRAMALRQPQGGHARGIGAGVEALVVQTPGAHRPPGRFRVTVAPGEDVRQPLLTHHTHRLPPAVEQLDGLPTEQFVKE